jgi:deoxyribodipyrimidine photo-lyase
MVNFMYEKESIYLLVKPVMRTRSRLLNDVPPRQQGSCVMYLMSRDQRVHDNWALHEAQQIAKRSGVPLVVMFHIFDTFHVRLKQQFDFMIAGLHDVEKTLEKLHIPFLLTRGNFIESVKRVDVCLEPLAWVIDFSPLRKARQRRTQAAKCVLAQMIEVDAHNIIPCWLASDHEEFAASTFRIKVKKNLCEWLKLPSAPHMQPPVTSPVRDALLSLTTSWKDVKKYIRAPIAHSYQLSFSPGESAAQETLQAFLRNRYFKYHKNRNDPNLDGQSDLSPYLHFGHIWSGRVAYEINIVSHNKIEHISECTQKMTLDPFIEELVVRRELAENYCFYQRNYDNLLGARPWARATLDKHRKDPRTHCYSFDQLENSQTHDSLWNAAQKQMVTTGKMHGYMRMYWAKKILEWTPQPETALKFAITLNDTYELDGADPNGYTGIMWSICGVHDRPWFDRPIFGLIRPMTASGMKKRFDTSAYIRRWQGNPS